MTPTTTTTTTPRFERAVKFVLDHETVFKPRSKWGDYAFATWECDRADPGGLTKFGIDQRSHPSEDIKALTLDQAKQIYFLEYWVPSGAEHLPAGYGEVLFDIRVNGGDGPRMLQRALNTLLPKNRKLTVDGMLGPRSVAAMEELGRAGLQAFLDAREERYRDLAKRKPALAKFLKGWLARNRGVGEIVLNPIP